MLTRLFFLFSIFIFGCAQDNTGDNQKQEELKICFTGDVLLDRGVRKVIERNSPSILFEKVKTFFQDKAAVVVNFECAATRKPTPVDKKFVFRAEPEWLSALPQAGVNYAVLANNHSYDQGREGMTETAGHLKKAGVIPIGYGDNQGQACSPTVMQKKEIKVAVFSSVWLTLERWNYLENEPGMCQCGVDQMCENIRQYHKKNPTHKVVVVLHWGQEYNATPSPDQRLNAGRLIDAGADAIIGHHPHVIQDMELIKGKPVFFSLGNFIFDHTKPQGTKAGLAELIFTKDSLTYKFYTSDIVNCIPQKPKEISRE